MPNEVTGVEVLYEVLLDLDLGTDPQDNQVWPMFRGVLPDVKPQGIALFDMSIPTSGRFQKTGETQGHEGIQIRVSAKKYSTARAKIKEIERELDNIVNYEVPVGNSRYNLLAVHRLRQAAFIGQDESSRDSFTLDCKLKANKIEV